MEDLEPGGVYIIRSRNLVLAVFDGTDWRGFIGIREKFGAHFLFTEYQSVSQVGEKVAQVPEGMDISEGNRALYDFLLGLEREHIGHRWWGTQRLDDTFAGECLCGFVTAPCETQVLGVRS